MTKRTYGIDHFQELQNHILLALDSARLKNLENRQETVGADNEVLGFGILPQECKLYPSARV